ncbi:hypothetical protein J3U99_18465 [Brucella pituitosa]|uniref:hypothetical protein n=1 Tax=Brucella pituitosa TaxID=571256 RepID=UPI000C27936B|nr:hypothetical protein [Brucella pituitosa]MCK4206765.1 hypothetical protein [Brucella pituitosa]PJO49226.1 hypothetical protein CWE02_05450 [Brucella pituitosa]PRA83982.1 hypothetical protein CQ054_17590 [Ochrobactrum sp. MYb29]
MAAEPKKSNPAIAAAIILVGFGVLAYYLPSIMIALGERSHVAAAIFGILFVLSFFGIFWLRSRRQNKD